MKQMKYWLIKDKDNVLDDTRRKVKSYAARRGILLPQALKELLEKALSGITD